MATLEEMVDKAIEVAVKRAILKAHPVGSLYLSLTDENPSISLGGVHGSRLARENVCGERTVAMAQEQRLVQGYRILRPKLKGRPGMEQFNAQPLHFLEQSQAHTWETPHGTVQPMVATTLNLTQANRTQSTVHQRRFNRPPWRSTFGRGQRNGND